MRLALADEFDRRNHDVYLVVVNARGPLLSCVPSGVKIVNLDAHRTLAATLKLRRWISTVRPDVVISSLDHNNIVALMAFMFNGNISRLIICQHNALSSELRLGWRYRLVPYLYWLLQDVAGGIVAVSAGVADDLAFVSGIARRRITVVPNPVISSSNFVDSGGSKPHPWFADRAVPVFVFIGRLVPQKDPLMLIEAFIRRLARGPARLIVLGEGALQPAMIMAAQRAGALPHIFFAGFVAEPLQWLAHAHVLLLTSRYEGFGNVIVEALACGIPVISTDCPHGPSEILDGGTYGVLVKPGDAGAFALAMAGDLRARFPAEILRARGRSYTVSHSADHVEKLFIDCPHRGAKAFGLTFCSDGPTIIGAQIARQSPSGVNLIVTPNVDHIRLFQQPAFFKACSAAHMVCADGWPIALYAGLRRATRWSRVTGCDILHAFMADEALPDRKVFAVLESAATARALKAWLSNRGIKNWVIEVAVTNFADDLASQMRLANRIKTAMADVVIMTIGAPVSEIFIDTHRTDLPHCWALCVGQAMRVELGLVARAPKAWRVLGLEWAWRCIKEPKRLPLRYFRDLLWFPRAIFNDMRLVRES